VKTAPIRTEEMLLSENISRDGILLRWAPSAALPFIGDRLTVDIDLPEKPGHKPRAMRCTGRVARIDCGGSAPRIALSIAGIRFVSASPTRLLEALPPASPHIN
jgi:hypothetical protein